MQVILLEKVRNLGDLGDTVQVKAGYGRNFLIPQGKAVSATEENVSRFAERRADLEKQSQERLAAAEKRAEAINALEEVTISALASDEGSLYGSIGPSDIADALQALEVEVTRKEINMPSGPIHNLGEHQVSIILHTDVTASVMVKILEAKD